MNMQGFIGKKGCLIQCLGRNERQWEGEIRFITDQYIGIAYSAYGSERIDAISHHIIEAISLKSRDEKTENPIVPKK